MKDKKMNIETIEIGENRCAKQTTVAIIINGDKTFVGSNSCAKPQAICPRNGIFETGKGYHLCKEICQQGAHAEVDACQKAGENAKGGTLFLLGHYYCCDNCISVMEKSGIKEVKILKDY